MCIFALAVVSPSCGGDPDWASLKNLILNNLASRHSRRAYGSALDEFAAWLISHVAHRRFERTAVLEYRAELIARGLSSASVNLRLSAVRRLAAECSESGLIASTVAAGVLRVPGLKRRGIRLGRWLTLDEAADFLGSVDRTSTKGKRDAALLTTLIGTGLRRDEIIRLSFDQIQLLSDRWVVNGLIGKGGRGRNVPIADWVKRQVDDWAQSVGILDGLVFRRVSKSGRVSDQGITGQCVFKIIRKYSIRSGLRVTPHDLRRTYARLAYDGKAPLEQIQYSLGHSSIATTELYLGVRQDLRKAPCDYFRIDRQEDGPSHGR